MELKLNFELKILLKYPRGTKSAKVGVKKSLKGEEKSRGRKKVYGGKKVKKSTGGGGGGGGGGGSPPATS